MADRAREREDVDELRDYLEAIGRVPLLSKEDEIELALAIEHCHEAEDKLRRDGRLSLGTQEDLRAAMKRGTQARQRFIQANLRLVVSIAKRYQGQGLSMMDLIQEGNIGLIRGVEKFDWRKGFKFSTYATWWIRQAIQRGIGNKARSIRLPVHVEEQYRRVRRKAGEIQQKTGDVPDSADIAHALKMSKARVEELLGLAGIAQPISLHAQAGAGEETELHELIEDVTSPAPYDAIEETLVREDIFDAIGSALDEREAQIISLRFGLDNGHPRSLQEIGDELKLSRERVRQIESQALAKLRETGRLSA